jgi:hypothetical protein
MALAFILPAPLAFVMLVRSFPLGPMTSVGNTISTVLTLAAMVVSVVSFSKATGAQFELKGSRTGILLSISGVLTYLLGTSLSSDSLHLLSIAVLYWGCVLSLGGLRSLISTVPGGLLLVSLYIPRASGIWGLTYLDVLSWSLIVASVALLLYSRRAIEPFACGLCASFRRNGEGFCRSCGRLVGKTTVALPRGAVAGMVAFTIIMFVLFTLTVPVLTTTPAASFVSYGLGGPQSSETLPLAGWSVKAQTFTVDGHQLSGYLLTSGKESIEAYVSASTNPQVVTSNLVLARGNSSDHRALPQTLGKQMSGYNLVLHGATYVDLQGLLPVAMLNGSRVVSSFVAVDLKQTDASFNKDNGTALYSVSTAFTGWTSSSAVLGPVVAGLISLFQSFSQETYFFSFATAVIVLFTVSRDDELAKVRRLESSHALTNSEAAILAAFGPGDGWKTGEQVQESAKMADPSVSDSNFFTALDSVSRRDLVRGSVVLRKRNPTLLWRSLI